MVGEVALEIVRLENHVRAQLVAALTNVSMRSSSPVGPASEAVQLGELRSLQPLPTERHAKRVHALADEVVDFGRRGVGVVRAVGAGQVDVAVGDAELGPGEIDAGEADRGVARRSGPVVVSPRTQRARERSRDEPARRIARTCTHLRRCGMSPSLAEMM